jgi:hypothetical protein
MKQCVYCLVPISKKTGTQTKDHIIPRNWSLSPDTNITVPCCKLCNNSLGDLEELFKQLYFMTGNKEILQKYNIYDSVKSSLGLNGDYNYKKHLRCKKILSLAEQYDPSVHKSLVLGLDNEKKLVVRIGPLLDKVFTKIFLGLEYAITQRVVLNLQNQFKINILKEGKNEPTTDLILEKFGTKHSVSGVLEILRLDSLNHGKFERNIVLYKAILWDKIIVYCSIEF